MKFLIKIECRTVIDDWDYDRPIPKTFVLYDWVVTPYYKETATYPTNGPLAKGTNRSIKKAQKSAERFAKRYAKAKGSEVGSLSYDYLTGNR